MKRHDLRCFLSTGMSIIAFSIAFIPVDGIASAQDISSAPRVSPKAQDDLGDIVVVARKRQENVLDVPISITVLSQHELAAKGVTRISDLVGSVPSFTSDGGGSVMGAFGLRGIVSQTRNIGFDSGLGVYIDGVLTVRPNGADQELPDIASVEVLRGPQGTLFGRNTTAGAIIITTRKPNLETPEADGRVAIGNLGQREGSLYLSTPLVPGKLALKLAGSISSRDGYLFNQVDGKNYNGLNRKSLRGGLDWQPTDALDVALTASYLKQQDSLVLGQIVDNSTGALAGLPGFSPDPYIIAQDGENEQDRRIWTTNLNIDWKIGDHKITSISAYGDNKSRAAADNDARPIPLSISVFNDGAKQFTQELRLASDRPGPLDYMVGLYFLHQNATSHRFTVALGPPGPGAYFGQIVDDATLNTDAYAAFASVDWRPVPSVTLNTGLRYGEEKKHLVYSQTNNSFVPLPNLNANLSRKDSNLSGNVSINYQVAPTTRIYASASRGFKSGGFNPDIVGDTDISFGPESVWSYEGGVKSELFDRKLRISAAGYYMNYSDLQVSALVGAAFQIRNAAAAKVKGFELEATAKPVRGVAFNFGIGYTDATYGDFPGCAPATNCAGRRLPYVAKWNLSSGIELTQKAGSGTINARADVTYRSDVFYEATNGADGNLPGYTLVNGKIGYSAADDHWSISMFAKNLLDKRYRDYSFYLAPFAQREDRSAVPRTFGVELTARY